MAQADDTGTEQFNAHVPGDMSDDIHEYRRSRGLSKSGATKQLIKQALDEPSARERRARDIKQLADHLVGIGLVAFLAGSFGPNGGIIVGLTLGLSFATVAAVAYLLQAYLKEGV